MLQLLLLFLQLRLLLQTLAIAATFKQESITSLILAKGLAGCLGWAVSQPNCQSLRRFCN